MRIYLSPPHMTGDEQRLVAEAFRSNWIAPVGPEVTAFEREMCDALRARYATALSSGTGALHLALLNIGVEPGNRVYCSTLTFAASANAIAYVGGIPVFIDSNIETWNMDPNLLTEELDRAAGKGELPKAVIPVDLYGQCADYDPILAACEKYDVPVIEDAAEALGATYKGKYAGTFGEMAVLSFNGNKIITTSGGGMLLTSSEEYAKRTLHLATQARDPAPHYQHSEIGYNYRLSNVLAAIGRGQLRHLREFVDKRRRNFEYYLEQLGDLPGLGFMPEAHYGKCNRWLTCITLDPKAHGITREDIRLHLESQNIETRPIWKPMHLQPVFKHCRTIGGKVSESIFDKGLCLPSGSNLTIKELERIVEEIRSCYLTI